MNGFTRYALRQLMVGMILVTAVLTSVVWLSQSLRFVEMIVNRGLSAGTFVYLTVLLLPNFLHMILPIAMFTAVVFTYNKMISDRELVVMRAAGQGQLQLAKPALILAFMVMGLGYSLNFHFLPESYRMFRELQWEIRYNYSHIILQEGTFNNVSDNVTVYIGKRSADGQLHNILVHDGRNPQKPATLMAERGALIEAAGAARVVMFGGNRQEVDRNDPKLSILYFDRYSFDLDTAREVPDARYREPRERMVSELFSMESDSVPDRDYGKFVVEAHNRLLSPLHILGYTMVGLACLMYGSLSRRGQNMRIVLAVAAVVLLLAATLGLENSAKKNLALVPLLYINSLLPVALGMAALLHHPRRRRRADEPAPA